eukprot:scaffold4733_cov170-Alexandrium_tamarense.AAC.49
MSEAVNVWVKTSTIESILHPNATPHSRRMGMHGSLGESRSPIFYMVMCYSVSSLSALDANNT